MTAAPRETIAFSSLALGRKKGFVDPPTNTDFVVTRFVKNWERILGRRYVF